MAIIRRELVVQLSDAEMKELAKQLADTNQRAARIEAEKKSRMSAYKAESDKCDAEIEAISLKITSGTEIRQIECEIRYHDPRERYKTTYRLDSGLPVGSPELMSAEELQDLFINALGEQNDFFVFRDHSRVDLVTREKIDTESGLYQGVVGPLTPEEMVDEPHTADGMIFIVTREQNESGDALYSLWKTSATKQIPASENDKEIRDAEIQENDSDKPKTQKRRK